MVRDGTKTVVAALALIMLVSGCTSQEVARSVQGNQGGSVHQETGTCDATGAVMTFEQMMSVYEDPAATLGNALAGDRFVCTGDHLLFALCLPPGDGGTLFCFVYAQDPDNTANRLAWSALDWQLTVAAGGEQRAYLPNPLLSELAVAQARELTPAMANLDAVALMYEIPTADFQLEHLVWQPGGRVTARFEFSGGTQWTAAGVP